MKERLKNVKMMNDIMCRMNNEESYMHWIVYVPDEATENDLIDIAEDIDMYDDCVSLFIRLINKFGSDGILEPNK